MQVPTLEQHKELEKQVQELRGLIHQMRESPLYLEWVSVDQACKILGIKTRETVIGMCKDERLEYKREGRKYQINYPSIIRYNSNLKIKR